jgi:response regulator RpfG family c-di-GMP phosphodiesterase
MQILIVDDSKVNLKLYTRLITQDGYGESRCFPCSGDALEWAKENDVALVIVDYNMPAPNGLDFIKIMRSMPGKEDVPILMVTADHARELRYEALECGANDFLTKPIDQVEFKARVKNMVALSESQRQLAETATWLADQVKAATAEIASRERETIMRLSLLAEQRNPETSAHLSRMASYCQIIARGAGLSPGEQELLLTASPLHDVGKVAIPDSILLKPAKLTSREYAIVKRHALVGYEILKDSTSPLLQLAAKIALTHHEKYDGSGYPQGLAADQIPLVGRICALSDVFDALTSVRPYKKAWPVNLAVAEIQRNRGTHFDPRLVDIFELALPELLRVKERFPSDVTRLPATTKERARETPKRSRARGQVA